MKIRSIQGYFGNLGGKRIELGEGFTSRVLPNGWGKSTLCAFLRVMLYGLNTTRRDTQNALSDKTHYLPQDGKPMSGRMTVLWKGRDIVITRSTGKGGLMQEFDAFYADTGEKCTFLNAKNCGETLLGMGEDAFLSSVFIDGTALQRPSEELRERMLAMAQTGDTQGRAADALRTLDRWRLDLDSGNGHGELPRLRQERAELIERLGKLDTADGAMERQRMACDRLRQEEAEAEAAYEAAYRAYAAEATGGQAQLDELIEQATRRVRALDEKTPPAPDVRAAVEALYGYEGAAKLEREKREKLPNGRTKYESALETLEEEQREDEIARNEAGRLRVRWIPLLLALVLAAASAATQMLDIDWGAYTRYVQWGLPVLAVLGLIAAFAGTVRKYDIPPRDFDAERQALLREREFDDAALDTASAVLQDAYDALLRAARSLEPGIDTIEQAARVVRQAADDIQTLRREQDALQELLLARKNLTQDASGQRAAVDGLRQQLMTVRTAAESARQTLAQMQGHTQALGADTGLQERLAAVEAAAADAQRRYTAICEAIDALKASQAELSARVAPRITALTQKYMEFLTEGAYSEVQLDTALTARCAGEDGLLLDGLRLSAGTRDQLYLALRLAVSAVLTDADDPAPLILDDPFLTFDDARTARAIMLLRTLGKERQVILLSCREFNRS